ncbi:hypothetical protein A2634_04270 [Candidatus Amesbacteria bacterium RIFCSPHIGHO2_01_FULL_48_32]|uniref:Thioredoxin domain-containing protein n=1 Tax=Candidatus Amesbacteria bacterium RIFCSPLOWO2_01_FULL_48_25 TaxID=1797259 RepID=A0A1F4ZCA6_9BACT|nr:MAG: hypothetical protein A2634_04270 [Candidatus Amesbacteria bacterium RIFCSPHIGHO2_01_FULL_48_32]OGD03933.1 MAG: hypothetical protein A2989_04235 [Candidatus Amesbacteria bacterium RIFCSPLOWO2_01_FULL_48_25]HJZ05456.1 hypothetical protein [Patescibacteria group bacterium]
MSPKLVLSVLAVILVIITGTIFLTRPSQQPKLLDQFAKCLTEEKVTMYGAYWCPHCQNQKKLFGDSFQFVPYVECTAVPKTCTEKGVAGYPTWITQDGTKLEGEQSLEKLSQISGCQLP